MFASDEAHALGWSTVVLLVLPQYQDCDHPNDGYVDPTLTGYNEHDCVYYSYRDCYIVSIDYLDRAVSARGSLLLQKTWLIRRFRETTTPRTRVTSTPTTTST